MKSTSVRWKVLILIGVLIGLLGAVPVTSAGNTTPPNPRVIPPQATVRGDTYGEWSAAFWQWLFSIPADQNPALDETGQKAGVGQTGSVWFLPGVFNVSGTASRSITIPTGIALFVAILNVECSTGEPDPFHCSSEQTCTACAKFWELDEIAAELDGRSINFDKANYEATSPYFPFYLPPNNILGLAPGQYQAVSNGFYLMLAPLSVGTHTLHFTGRYPQLDFSLDITYEIQVVPNP